jgi:UDP-glucose 4-epimerase
MQFDNVLVTGGAGFIGSHTVDALLKDGISVWVLDDLSTGSSRNLQQCRSDRHFHFRRGNTLQVKVVDALSQKVDAIIHMAAIVSPYYSVKKPQLVNAANVTGTLNILNAALRRKTKRLVFASSSSVYGEQTRVPIAEGNPLHPITPYGASKLSGEKYCEAYNRTYGLSTISLRYFNVYGERQSANPYSGVIAIFSKRLRRGVEPVIYGDGSQTRDFVHVSDVVRANLQALNTNAGAGAAFNVGTGRPISINELASLLAKLAGRPDITPTHAPVRAGDIRDSCADITRSKQVLGFEPKVELEQGLKLLINSVS